MRVRPERLVVATGNPGKLREFRTLLADLPVTLLAQSELGICSAAETGASFLANALLKARHAAAASGLAALADDSGLEVDALGGAPGVLSARYAGELADDAANNAKLLADLAQTTDPRRSARFRCVLAYVGGPDERRPVIAEGVWEGTIVKWPRGAGGFGYDPYFQVTELGVTAAELSLEQKNSLSHRAAAFRVLRTKLAVRNAAGGS